MKYIIPIFATTCTSQKQPIFNNHKIFPPPSLGFEWKKYLSPLFLAPGPGVPPDDAPLRGVETGVPDVPRKGTPPIGERPRSKQS